VTARAGLAACSLAAVLLGVAGCGGGKPAPSAGASQEPPAPGVPAEAQAQLQGGEPEPEPLGRTAVTLYFPSAAGDGLVEESREIFATPRPEDRAKQILSDLISGPSTDDALAALPPGTRLRQVYVLEDGTAYADFSSELLAGTGGGSDDEIQSVYAIVNSIALNVPGILRVGILIEGRPCETLGGHVDLRRPLRADPTLIEDVPTEDAPPGTELPPVEPPATGGPKPIEV